MSKCFMMKKLASKMRAYRTSLNFMDNQSIQTLDWKTSGNASAFQGAEVKGRIVDLF